MQLTLPLSSPDLTLANAGGKGANLSVLIRGGFDVPGGFVVTTAGYDHFVKANGLAASIVAQVAAIDTTDPTAYDRASAEIRGLFARASLPDALRKAILAAFREAIPDASPVAVRSSATAEDLPDASFAGQQETYLNVIGPDALLDGVIRCWASLWTGRAIAYRRRQSIAPEDVSLAVVVQQMVPAEVAGVLFTVNPVTGDDGQVIINATWGLGEALVAGQVNPDTYIAAKESGGLLEVAIGDKAVMTAAQTNGTAEVAVDTARQSQRALTDAQVGELVGIGRRIEQHFNSPQDVEWAYADGKLYLLQSRPVTTTAQPNRVPGDDAWPPIPGFAPQPFDWWTQADVGERWPEPVTPFTWSTGYEMVHETSERLVAGVKAPYKGHIQWAKRAHGHVYFNEGAVLHAYTDGYGFAASMVAPSISHINPETKLTGWRWGKVLDSALFMMRRMGKWNRDIAHFPQEFATIDRLVDDFMDSPLDAQSDGDLCRGALVVWRDRLMHYMDYHLASTSLSMQGFGSLEATVEKATGRRELAQELVSGLSGIISAEMVPDLWRIAQEIRGAGLADELEALDPTAALAALRADERAASALALFERFLRRHGHRCMSEAEFLVPRWAEVPEQAMEMVQGYLRAAPGFDPAQNAAHQQRQREESQALVESKLNPLQRIAFRRSLISLQEQVRVRDNGQHYLVKLFLPVRRLIAELGRRWAQRGWLAQPDDIFFLAHTEIEEIVAANDPRVLPDRPDLAALVADRRAAWEYWHTQPAPDVLDPQGRPVDIAGDAISPDDPNVLRGIAASRGRVTGIARVVLTPADAARIQPGEILVTRATDPGWTPVFSTISGLVLEIGGQLSHGAIVAREYGLPAVINVTGATRQIVDGETITVDGSAGTVTQAVSLRSAN